MKRNSILFSIIIVLVISSCQAQKVNKHLIPFAESFSTANSTLLGNILLSGEYKDDCSTLTYEKYLILLQQHKEHSTKDVAKSVQRSDKHYFVAKKNTFYIVIYSKKMDAVVYDDAGTPFCDSIIILKKNPPNPDLDGYIGKSHLN